MINNPKSDHKKKKGNHSNLLKKIKVMSKKLLLVKKKKKNQLTRQSINKSDSLHSFLLILERENFQISLGRKQLGSVLSFPSPPSN